MHYITPVFLTLVILFALSRKRTIYNDFICGAGDGLKIITDIFPPLVAMLTAAAMLKASGALEIAVNFLSPLTKKVGIPAEVMPLIMLRPVSGSGSMGMLSGILSDYGADSFAGRLASIICGSTETTFYCLAIYFAKTRVKSIKRAVPCAVLGDLAGIFAAVITLKIIGF